MGRLSDPAWKSGPTHPKPTSDEHSLSEEPYGSDMDGFGRDEEKAVDGEPLLAIQEAFGCVRDGCDAAEKRRILFTTDPLSDDERDALRKASGVNEPSVHVFENAERVGPNAIDVSVDNGEPIHIPAEETVVDEATGPCFGHVEPDPEPQWRDV